MKEVLQEFINALNAKFPKEKHVMKEGYMLVPGRKYTKVVAERDGHPTSVYAFIDNTTGDLFKPAGWGAPAKHARGNINNESGLKACGPYGVAYLR